MPLILKKPAGTARLVLFRRDTAEGWEQHNPVLVAGEPGYCSTTGTLRIGDGETPWVDLPVHEGLHGHGWWVEP